MDEQRQRNRVPAGGGGNRDVLPGSGRLGGAMNDNGPRLRDIALLLVFAVLLRIAECFDRDTPGWWRQERHDWRMAVDTDALERREVHE